MLKERDRQIPAASLIYPLGQGEEINGAADATRLLDDSKRVEAAQRLAASAEEATERILLATMQRRAANMIPWGIAQLKPGAGAAQLNYLTNHIHCFARDAAEFLEHGDMGGLDRAISTFHNAVMELPKMEPPKPPLMPSGDNVFIGWSREEQLGLRTILVKGLAGVTVGDRCISVDAKEATLASGKRVSRAQALEAHIPPAGGEMIAVGSLSRVLAVIDARR